MQCVADEEKFKVFYHKTHRYSVKYFKEQIMEPYVQEHPVELPENDTWAKTKDNEEGEVRRRSSKTISPVKQQENVDLIRSGGLYRNHDSPEHKVQVPMKRYQKNFQKKKTKKSEEPLVWVVNSNT